MIKKKLQTWLINSGCSRKQLAEFLNVSPRTVDAWLAHKGRPIPAKMHKPIEELIAPKFADRDLSDTEREFYAIPDKMSREFWLQEKMEKILVLAHRAMSYWDTNYSNCNDDYVFYEEFTDLTLEIKKLSNDVTSMGAHHADCILFNDYDEAGNLILKK